MNQILVTEKLYVTPEMRKKKFMYKLEFSLSIFLVCLLFSYYIYAAYDRNKTEQVSQEILAQLKYNQDLTDYEEDDDDVLVVILNKEQDESETTATVEKVVDTELDIDTNTYVSSDGVEYTTEAILKIPSINIEYPILSTTSDALLYVSLNKYWGPSPNEVGNYCIVGHYYESGIMFGRLHELQNGDTAELTDLSGRTITYQVYNKYVVEPTDTSCTSQLTNGKRELTLITCTNYGKQRLVVKLREVSD